MVEISESGETEPPTGWPRYEAGQVRVMLFGTYHMDSPGLDELNVDADDVLAPERQEGLRDLTGRLGRWNPERVAVERPYDRTEDLNDLFDAYRSSEYAYDQEVEIDPLHPSRDDPRAACRSEIVQIGVRLADQLGHERVYPVDAPATLGNDDLGALEERGYDPTEKASFSLRDPETAERELDERLRELTLVEYHRYLNGEENLAVNQRGMFGTYLRYGEGENFGGPRVLSTWYDRNIRIAHNLWRAVEAGDERVLLIIGSGHVRVLRHLLDEAPMFCPTSPLPYL
ncbi:DUF5694 domain-containing protein [Halostella pelagica]|uniref:DUF5694 domain-containing protein n=1 Tax=Halostella pelagica TaxID=2583824 RepID=UPI001F31DA18|nr:DUF5694 domain-containing protein [Halostella pelagica]